MKSCGVQVKAKNVPLSSVFSTLQAYLGSAYVNDFNLDGRTYQVRIQADAKFRATKQDILDLQVRSLDGNAIPMGTLINITEEFGPSVIRRYQMYPSASINGSAGADMSSGEALNLMEQLATQTLPDQFGFEWTGLSYQEKLLVDKP